MQSGFALNLTSAPGSRDTAKPPQMDPLKRGTWPKTKEMLKP
jgi:hypothetical protein